MNSRQVLAIFISPAAGTPMIALQKAEAIAGQGLLGDRYCSGEGSFNRGKVGKRQVTFIDSKHFQGSGFDFDKSRRNVVTINVELMDLIGKKFTFGSACFRGVKYCDPCPRPSELSGNPRSFQEVFLNHGGLVAEVLEGGIIRVGDIIILPPDGF